MPQPTVIRIFFFIFSCLIIPKHYCKKTHNSQHIGIPNHEERSAYEKYSLFTKTQDKDVAQVSVCQQQGVSDCTLVTMNFQVLSNENNVAIYVPDIGNLALVHTEEIYDILHLNYQNEEETMAYITYYDLEQSIIGTFSLISGETRKLEKCGESCYVFYKVTEKKWTDDYDTDCRNYITDPDETIVKHENNEEEDKNIQPLSLDSCIETYNLIAKNESFQFETKKNESKTISKLERQKDIQLKEVSLQLYEKEVEVKAIKEKLEECQGENMKNVEENENESSDSINIDPSSNWSECSKICGEGIMTRNYTIADPAVLNQTVKISKVCNRRACLKLGGNKKKLIIKENNIVTVYGESEHQVTIGYFLMGGGGGGKNFCGGGSGFIEYGEDFNVEANSDITVTIGEGGKSQTSEQKEAKGKKTKISAGSRKVFALGGNVPEFTRGKSPMKRTDKGGTGWSGGGISQGGHGGSNGSDGGNGTLPSGRSIIHIMGGKGSRKALPKNLPELSPGRGGRSQSKTPYGGGGGGVLLNGDEGTQHQQQWVGQGYGGGGAGDKNGQNGIVILWIVD